MTVPDPARRVCLHFEEGLCRRYGPAVVDCLLSHREVSAMDVRDDGVGILSQVGHRVLHNKLQSIVQAMMKLGGINSEKEAVNFLLGKVSEPHIFSYVNHVAREANLRKDAHAIVANIHARNFPVGQ